MGVEEVVEEEVETLEVVGSQEEEVEGDVSVGV